MVLLYGSEIWVMTVLEGFYHKITRQIAGMTVRKGHKGKWECASVEAALETTGILSIREYMRRWQAIIAEYVSGRTIYELCTG